MEETPRNQTPAPGRRSKRLWGSPTGTTPQQTVKKKSERKRGSRKRLEYSSLEEPLANLSLFSDRVSAWWSTGETKALVEFVLLHSPNKWPCTKEDRFWKSAATFVHDQAQRLQARNLGGGVFKMK